MDFHGPGQMTKRNVTWQCIHTDHELALSLLLTYICSQSEAAKEERFGKCDTLVLCLKHLEREIPQIYDELNLPKS